MWVRFHQVDFVFSLKMCFVPMAAARIIQHSHAGEHASTGVVWKGETKVKLGVAMNMEMFGSAPLLSQHYIIHKCMDKRVSISGLCECAK